MRRKRTIHESPVTALSSAGHSGDLIEDYNELLERFRGSFAVILNQVSDGLHKIVLDSSFGEMSYRFAMKNGTVIFLEDYPEFLESIASRLLLVKDAHLILVSSPDYSSSSSLRVNAGSPTHTRLWIVHNNGLSIIGLDAHRAKKHIKNSFLSLSTGKTSYKTAWDIS